MSTPAPTASLTASATHRRLTMRRASTEEEILNYVSKKLATAQLSQRRNQPSTAKRLPHHAARPSTRIVKSSSRHGSPKSSDNPVSSVPTSNVYPDLSQLSGNVRSSSVIPVPRVRVPKYGRPFSWHTYASAAPQLNIRCSNPIEWQSSSYDWPEDVHCQQSPASYDWTQPTYPPTVLQPYSSVSSNQEPLESSFASYFPWSQTFEDADTPLHSAVIHEVHQPAYPFPLRQASSQPDPFVLAPYDLPSSSSRPQQIPDSERSKDEGEVGEELVGLGLYNNRQDASPKQLCAALPPSFVPNGSYGTSDQPQKLEDTWQQPPEWQQSESLEGSEASASASPYENFTHQALSVTQPSSIQASHNFPVDFSSNPFLFENDVAWFPEDPKHLSYQSTDLGGYQWFDQPNRSTYI